MLIIYHSRSPRISLIPHCDFLLLGTLTEEHLFWRCESRLYVTDIWICLWDVAVKVIVIVTCVCLQSQDGRFEVRGRHGKSVLTISGVRLSDLGRFDCEALSRIGGHQKSMFLDIECEYVYRCFRFLPANSTVHTVLSTGSEEKTPARLYCRLLTYCTFNKPNFPELN